MLNIAQNSRRTPADKNKELEAVLRSRQTRIRVVGCGGGGNNTITRLMEVGVNGIETLAINTDAQDLLAANADDKILIGQNITKGLGAGSNPQIGEDSARENQQEIEEALVNTDLVFVTCGLGGGTGTGSAPIVAEIAKKIGALTISVVTLPFADEGVSRRENAKRGLEKLRQNSDTVIAIQNDRLLEVVPDLPLGMAFKVADEILVNAVKGITELITEKGLINLDFADVRAIMQNGGAAMIGLGESDESDGVQAAVEMAMQNKLLDVDIAGAQNVLINITGGAQMPLKDAKRVMQIVAEKLDNSAKIIWGARIDPTLDKTIRVMLIVTGLQEKREAADGRKKNLEISESPLPAVQSEEELFKTPAEAQENDTPAPHTAVEANNAAAASFMPATASLNGNEAGLSEAVLPKRQRKTSPAKSPKKSTQLITGEQVLKLIESSAPAAAREDIIRVTYADGLAPQENKSAEPSVAATKQEIKNHVENLKPAPIPPAASPAASPENRVNVAEPNIRISQSMKPSVPLPNRMDAVRKFGANDLPPKPASSAANGMKPVVGNSGTRPQPAARNAVPSSNPRREYNKIFAEQSRVHLQVIREAIGHLFTDPTRQETLQRIKHAAIAVNNLAKRFVFDVFAAYAATIEEVCERVLDGEINMSKKLVNAFTEIPAIFDNMVHGDADALIEAKRHQERLQRLADSFMDGEVVNPRIDKTDAPAYQPARAMETPAPRPAPPPRPASMPATKTASPPDRRPRPATEVMEYLDDLFAEGKKPPGR